VVLISEGQRLRVLRFDQCVTEFDNHFSDLHFKLMSESTIPGGATFRDGNVTLAYRVNLSTHLPAESEMYVVAEMGVATRWPRDFPQCRSRSRERLMRKHL
jgi:hypothetical protein